MNYKLIGRFLSQIVVLEGLFLLPALCIGLYLGETAAVRGILLTLLVMAITAGLLALLCRGPGKLFGARECMVCVSISWLVLTRTYTTTH